MSGAAGILLVEHVTLIEAEPLIPASADPAEVLEAQKKLAVSMLTQATADLTGRKLDHGDSDVEGAEDWIGRDEDEIPGFIWCCHVLGLRHTVVRAAIIERPEEIAKLLARFIETQHKIGVPA